MSASDQDLAGLPEDVREALSYFADAETALEGEGHNGTMYATIRAELVRLARENAELTRALTERLDICGAAVQRAERAESELAALKRRIAEAPTATVTNNGDTYCHLYADPGTDLADLDEQGVALLPVGGE